MQDSRLSNNIQHSIAHQGFVFVRQHLPELQTIDAIKCLGEMLTLDGLSTCQELRPRTLSSAPPNTYSGNFGMAEFPLHTDLAHWAVPPHYIALRCIKGAQNVATRLFDGKVMIDDVSIIFLRRILVQPRRPLGNGKQLLRLLDHFEGYAQPILRWDSIFLRPATIESEARHAIIERYVEGSIPKEIFLLNSGDTLIIDNWRMLHGRSPTSAEAASRHIERVYMGELH